MANSIKLTFAGDADSLAKAAKKSEQSLGDVGSAADKSGKQLSDSSKQSADLGGKMGHLGSAVSGAGDAFDAIGGSLDAVNQLQQAGAERASRLAHAVNDVEQAQEDLNQAFRDGKQAELDVNQAAIDLEQANLDAATAQQEYNKAVKEHGKNSAEAKQAALDLKQAQQDVGQANEDSAQAARDAAQATIDAKAAQIDLNDANREAHPPEMQKWAEGLQMITPLISAVVGVVGLVTAAQWLWNASLWASPVTWIVIGIVALVAAIIWVATQTTIFQDTWKAVWGFLKDVGSWFAGPFKDFLVNGFHFVMNALGDWWGRVKAVPGQIKSAFSAVTDFITAPFRAAFNYVSTAWNNTVGRLHWSVPGWVPGIGGNSFSAPTLPHFHQGGIVPGGLGAETLAVLQAGERVTPMGAGGGHAETLLLGSDGSDFGDFLVDQLNRAIARRGGDPSRVLGNRRG